jgi:hypothetical protein
MTSCKLTGNFAVIKRQHSNGYYIQTPSFVKNSDSKTTSVTKHIKQPEPIKTVIKPDNDNLIAATGNSNIPQIYQPKPTIKVYECTNEKECENKAAKIVRSIINKHTVAFPIGKTDDKPKVHWAALAGFICGLLAPIPYMFYIILGGTLAYLGIPIILFSFGALFLSSYGLRKINTEPIKYKGRAFAITGLVLGLIVIAVLVVEFLILSYKGLLILIAAIASLYHYFLNTCCGCI